MEGCLKISMPSSLCQYQFFSHLTHMLWAQSKKCRAKFYALCSNKNWKRLMLIIPPCFKIYQFSDHSGINPFGKVLWYTVVINFTILEAFLLYVCVCLIYFLFSWFFEKIIKNHIIFPKRSAYITKYFTYFRCKPIFMHSL